MDHHVKEEGAKTHLFQEWSWKTSFYHPQILHRIPLRYYFRQTKYQESVKDSQKLYCQVMSKYLRPY